MNAAPDRRAVLGAGPKQGTRVYPDVSRGRRRGVGLSVGE
jgi:hypothetical protein